MGCRGLRVAAGISACRGRGRTGQARSEGCCGAQEGASVQSLLGPRGGTRGASPAPPAPAGPRTGGTPQGVILQSPLDPAIFSGSCCSSHSQASGGGVEKVSFAFGRDSEFSREQQGIFVVQISQFALYSQKCSPLMLNGRSVIGEKHDCAVVEFKRPSSPGFL